MNNFPPKNDYLIVFDNYDQYGNELGDQIICRNCKVKQKLGQVLTVGKCFSCKHEFNLALQVYFNATYDPRFIKLKSFHNEALVDKFYLDSFNWCYGLDIPWLDVQLFHTFG